MHLLKKTSHVHLVACCVETVAQAASVHDLSFPVLCYVFSTLSLKITHHQCCNHCRRRWGLKKRKGTAKDKMPIGKEDKKKSSRRRRIHQVIIIIITFTQMKVPTKDRSQRFPLAQGRGKGHVTWRVSDDGRARCS
uniref:Secreted protein n=1 Tax=Timema bartmani TaxID=61472 RepID=A0A7R9F794_9NEOP|nr:unnamed protein product [Timema bartmani]